MPAATLQMDLERPCAPVDRMTIAPGTSMTTFSEQSRTTFRHVPGRVSIILSEPEKRLTTRPDQILAEVCSEARQVGIEFEGIIRDWRVIARPDDFYSLSPGTEALRPQQRTPIPGLTLAGDYTEQKYLATMEGAVFSGKRAAAVVLGQVRKSRTP
jgi:15-cis-phytoene desaturase